MNTTQLRSNIAQNTSSVRIYSSGNGQGWNLGPVFRENFPQKGRTFTDVKIQRAILGPDARCYASKNEDNGAHVACASLYMIWGTGMIKHIKAISETVSEAAPIISAMNGNRLLDLAGSLYDQTRYYANASETSVDKRLSGILFWRLVEADHPDWVRNGLYPVQNKEAVRKRIEGIEWSWISQARNRSDDDLRFEFDPVAAFKDTARQLGISASGSRNIHLALLNEGEPIKTAGALDFARALRMDPLLRLCASSWDKNKLLGFILAMRNRAAQRPLLGPDRDSAEMVKGWHDLLAQEVCERSGIR